MALLAGAETVRERGALCRACEHAVGPSPEIKLFCGKCGCPLAGKIRLASASCPAGKWSPSTGAKKQ